MAICARLLAAMLLGVVALSAANATSGLDQSFLIPMGPVAQEQANHLLRVIGITMIVILPVLIGVPLILWRYRLASPKGDYTPRWEFSRRLEWVLWGVPVLVVALLASWLWYSAEKLDKYVPVGPRPLQVQAIGLDWKWVFLYPEEGIATVDELAVPVGRPVELTLTTDTVMQSLLISSLTGQIYAMPGMTTRLNFSASRPGLAEGENTQFNGTGFGRQKFLVRALAPADYAAWTDAGRTGPLLDQQSYAILRRQTVRAAARTDLGLPGGSDPILMRLGDPTMFTQIVGKYHRGGGGPAPADWGGIGRPAVIAAGGVQ